MRRGFLVLGVLWFGVFVFVSGEVDCKRAGSYYWQFGGSLYSSRATATNHWDGAYTTWSTVETKRCTPGPSFTRRLSLIKRLTLTLTHSPHCFSLTHPLSFISQLLLTLDQSSNFLIIIIHRLSSVLTSCCQPLWHFSTSATNTSCLVACFGRVSCNHIHESWPDNTRGRVTA